MRDPVIGEFRISGEYFVHPNSSSYRKMLTGVISAPGVPPTVGEHLDDGSGRHIGHDVLPALVDRADPNRFSIIWDEIPKPDFRAQARVKAEEAAARIRSGSGRTNQTQVHVHDGSSPTETPDWVREIMADPTVRDLITGDGGEPVVVVNGGTRIIDLTAGHLSAAEAADLCRWGRPATAILMSVTQVAVPQGALPTPTASLCDLALRVRHPAGRVYDATIRLGFRDASRRAQVAVIGAVLPVRIDPEDDMRLAMDVYAYDAAHPTR